MTPFERLGLPNSASKDDAQRAYRKLAMQHHPDRGGNAETFKAVKEAWEQIEKGWKYEAPQRSSMSDGPKAKPKAAPERPKQQTAGKPAPGYEARGKPPPMPRARRRAFSYTEHEVDIEVTEDQAFEGCTVPFVCNGTVLEYVVRPGSTSRIEPQSFPLDTMIGSQKGYVTVYVNFKVAARKSEPEEQTRDVEIVIPLSALGLFVGGKITVQDHLGEKIPLSIPPGYDPSEPLKIPGKGHGTHQRGNLLVRIQPIFKQPKDLNQNELQILQRLNELTK